MKLFLLIIFLGTVCYSDEELKELVEEVNVIPSLNGDREKAISRLNEFGNAEVKIWEAIESEGSENGGSWVKAYFGALEKASLFTNYSLIKSRVILERYRNDIGSLQPAESEKTGKPDPLGFGTIPDDKALQRRRELSMVVGALRMVAKTGNGNDVDLVTAFRESKFEPIQRNSKYAILELKKAQERLRK